MSIANRITGMTDLELQEYDFPRLHSLSQINPDTIHLVRGCVRIQMGLMVASDDLDKEREEANQKMRSLLERFRQEAE